MEVQIVEFFKGLSSKIGDVFFTFTNVLGEDLFFYLVFFALYWVYSKNYAFKFGLVYFSSCFFNMFMKKMIKRPRPIGATAGGYSFPSGHAQSFSSVGSGLLYESNKQKFPTKKWQRAELICEFIIFGALVGIGRMYWGQHYLTDVIAGLVMGIIVTVAVTYILDLIISRWKWKNFGLDKILLVMIPLVVIAYVVVATTDMFTDPDDLSKIYRFIGIFLSVAIGYLIDKKWIKYDTEDTMKNKMIKIASGWAVLGLFYGFVLINAEVNAFLPLYYLVVGLLGTIVLPWVFKTIKNPEGDK